MAHVNMNHPSAGAVWEYEQREEYQEVEAALGQESGAVTERRRFTIWAWDPAAVVLRAIARTPALFGLFSV